MTHSDDQMERLIVKSLHGELDDEHSLELKRELIRDTQLRALHDDLAAVDRLACEALGAAFSRRTSSPLRRSAAAATESRGRLRAWTARLERAFLPLAVAAAIMVAVLLPVRRTPDPPSSSPWNASGAAPYARGPSTELSRPVSTAAPANTRRNTSRDVIGVIDREGKVWILELDRTQTIRIPGGRASDSSNPDGL